MKDFMIGFVPVVVLGSIGLVNKARRNKKCLDQLEKIVIENKDPMLPKNGGEN